MWCSGERTWNSSSVSWVGLPGRATISLGSKPWASCLHTLPPQILSSKKLGYKREFLALKWL